VLLDDGAGNVTEKHVTTGDWKHRLILLPMMKNSRSLR
jgi:hypothetical protein